MYAGMSLAAFCAIHALNGTGLANKLIVNSISLIGRLGLTLSR